MTIDEAIMILDNERPCCGAKIVFSEEERYTAYSMAIEALEKSKAAEVESEVENG